MCSSLRYRILAIHLALSSNLLYFIDVTLRSVSIAACEEFLYTPKSALNASAWVLWVIFRVLIESGHIANPYSKTGLMNETYIALLVRSLNPNPFIPTLFQKFIAFLAFSHLRSKCIFQSAPSPVNHTPRYLNSLHSGIGSSYSFSTFPSQFMTSHFFGLNLKLIS